MSFLKNLFGKKEETATPAAVDQSDCPHAALAGRWDSVQDMGLEEKVTSYVCETCGKSMTPEEGRAIREGRA